MERLKGKVAIVTGAARGQGAVEARLFAAQGAALVVTDLRRDSGEATAAAVGGTFIEHDVADPTAWTAVVEAALDRHGRIDVLVNNAGIYHGARLVDTELEDFERVMRINATGVFLGMKAVGPVMRDQGAGSIINISSVAGMVAAPGAFAYGASKWAVRGMTKTAAVELSCYGVRVNSIHPGLIQTDMLDDVIEEDARRRERMLRRVPLGRVAEPADIANMALYLASEESRYATGSEFVVDGGWVAQ